MSEQIANLVTRHVMKLTMPEGCKYCSQEAFYRCVWHVEQRIYHIYGNPQRGKPLKYAQGYYACFDHASKFAKRHKVEMPHEQTDSGC